VVFFGIFSIPLTLPPSCSHVSALSFEELVVADGLLAAVLTPACRLQLSVKDHFIEHFPQNVQLSLLLKKVCWSCFYIRNIIVVVETPVDE